MSEYPNPSFPPPQGTMNYFDGGGPPTPAKPGGLTAIAIIGIVLAALGLLCTGFSAVMTGIQLGVGHAVGNTAMQVPVASSVITLVLGLAAFALWGLLLAGCIGALSLKRWSHALLVRVSVADLIFGVAKLAVTLLVVVPATAEVMRTGPQAQQTAAVANIMGPMLYGMPVLFWAISILYPIATLVVLRRPDVREALCGPVAQRVI